MTRAFVAIPLPDRLRWGLSRAMEGLPVGRRVDEDNLHLTLAFLDDQDDAALEEVHDTLSALAAAEFKLTLAGLGTFGGARPRALWIGVTPEPQLVELERSVRRAVRHAGVELPHRRFVPHVTLARFGSDFTETAAFTRFAAAHAGLTMPPFPVQAFGLYASTLRSDGAVYDELARYPLRSGGT